MGAIEHQALKDEGKTELQEICLEKLRAVQKRQMGSMKMWLVMTEGDVEHREERAWRWMTHQTARPEPEVSKYF